MLRQFAWLLLAVLLGLAAWRWVDGRRDAWTWSLAAGALGAGVTGLVRPAALRPLFTAWMAAAFPIGWTISHAVLAAVFFAILTPIGLLFRALGRDELRLRHPPRETCWVRKAEPRDADSYLRQF
jgi:hypothetical protein